MIESSFADTEDGRLWALRMKSPAEVARSAPVTRAHRKVREMLDDWQAMGWRAGCELEAFYQPGHEGIYVSFNSWTSEQRLLYRGKAGAWEISVEVFERMGLLGDPSAFLAECL